MKWYLSYYNCLILNLIFRFYGIAYSFSNRQELRIGLLEEKVKYNLH